MCIRDRGEFESTTEGTTESTTEETTQTPVDWPETEKATYWDFSSDKYAAVSYTHLDVYKRQVLLMISL